MAVRKTPEQRVFNQGDAPTDPNAARQIAELKSVVEKTENERNAALDTLHQVEAARDEMTKERDAWRHQAETASTPEQVERVETENTELKAERELARASVDRLQAEMAKRSEELGQARIMIRRLEGALADAKSHRDVALDERDRIKAELDRMRQVRAESAIKAGPGVKTDDLGAL